MRNSAGKKESTTNLPVIPTGKGVSFTERRASKIRLFTRGLTNVFLCTLLIGICHNLAMKETNTDGIAMASFSNLFLLLVYEGK